MDEKRIPWSWLGGQLILARVGAIESELVVLKDASELGLSYAYEAGEVEGGTVFVPWSAVSWMRQPVPADLEDPGAAEAESEE